jgi:hypothetical protein
VGVGFGSGGWAGIVRRGFGFPGSCLVINFVAYGYGVCAAVVLNDQIPWSVEISWEIDFVSVNFPMRKAAVIRIDIATLCFVLTQSIVVNNEGSDWRAGLYVEFDFSISRNFSISQL